MKNVYPIHQDAQPAIEPKRSLWNRVRSVGHILRTIAGTDLNDIKLGAIISDAARASVQNIRNKTANDWAWTGATIGVGAAAKFGLLAGATALVGASAMPVIFTAAAGGAAVGLVRAGMKHIREQKEANPNSTWKALLGFERNYVAPNHFFSKKTLMSTASSAAISAATFGVLDGIEHFTGINIGQHINKGVSALFNKAATPVGGGIDLVNSLQHASGKVTYDVPFVAPRAALEQTIATENLSAEKAAPVAAKAKVAEFHKVAPAAHHALPAKVTPVVELPEIAKAIAPMTIDVDVAGKGSVSVELPQLPNVAQELARAQVAVNAQYVEDHLRDVILQTTGVAAPADMSVDAMAKEIAPNNPQALIKVTENYAPKLDASKMAGACVTQIPTSQAALLAHNNVVPTTCHSVKADMAAGDFMTLRDAAVNDPTPKKGLRLLFSAAKTKITDFIDTAVSREAVPSLMPQFEEAPLVLAEAAPIAPAAPAQP